jgi:hypothetical protein
MILRRLILLTACFLLVTLACQAQTTSPEVTLYGGYNYTHTDSSLDMNGFDISGSFRATDNIYIKGDFKTGFKQAYGRDFHLFTYTAGPVYSFRAHRQVRPFAEVLLGGARFGGEGPSDNAFAAQFGGGLDVSRRRWGLRVIEVDYLYTHFLSAGQSNLQISTGVLWHFR